MVKFFRQYTKKEWLAISICSLYFLALFNVLKSALPPLPDRPPVERNYLPILILTVIYSLGALTGFMLLGYRLAKRKKWLK